MNHWHRCARWTGKNLACPFAGGADHERIGAPEEDREDESPPRPMAPERKARTKWHKRLRGQLAGAPGIPQVLIEDLVDEVLREIPDDPPDAEPFPVAPPGRGVPKPTVPPAVPPVPVPAVPVPVHVTAARRAVQHAYQRGPGEGIGPMRKAAIAEEATASTFEEGGGMEARRTTARKVGPRRPKIHRAKPTQQPRPPPRGMNRPFPRPGGGGGRGGGFFWNQARWMKQMTR